MEEPIKEKWCRRIILAKAGITHMEMWLNIKREERRGIIPPTTIIVRTSSQQRPAQVTTYMTYS